MSCSVNLRALPTEVLEEVFTPENIRVRPMANSVSTLSFPESRCALWDGAATGEKVPLHLCSHRAPRVQLTEKALRLAQRHLRHSSRTLLHCFFIGAVSVDSDEEGVTVTLDRFDPGRDQNGARVPTAVLPGDVCAPCVFTSDPGALVQSEAELLQAFKTLQQSVSGRQSLDLSQILRLRLHVVWTQALDRADFALAWSCLSPASSAHVEPIRAAHVIPTALVRSLTSPVRPTTSSRQRGFVTMDQTRKLLLLLESDPKALSLPLVGVWFSGAAQVHSPQIWLWILRFLHSSSIKDRVFSESGCFLLVLFGSTHRAPQFFQCKTNGAGRELQFQLLTGQHRTTLYQQVASVEGQTLKCDLSSETESREKEVFRQAQRTFHSSAAVAQGGALSVTDQDSGVEDEDLSPRPSPSPHLPPPQTRKIQPSVPELSLLIDSSFSSNHNAPRPQAPPLPSDRKCVSSLLQLHSTPHSNLQTQNPNCVCCNSNNPICTTIHPTPGQNQPQIHQKTPQSYHQVTPIPQNVHPAVSSKHPSPSSHRQSPSGRRKSSSNQAQSPRTPPVSQSHQTVMSRSNSQTRMTPPQPCQSPQQRAVSSPNHNTPILTTTVQPALQNFHQSPSNPAQNHPSHNFTPQAANGYQSHFKTQVPQNPALNIFQTPQNVSKLHQCTAGMNNSHLPTTNMDSPTQNVSQTPPLHCMNLNFPATNQQSSPSQANAVPQFTSRSPSVMLPSCATFPALPPPPPVACGNHCCEQQVALSSGEAYQLLLQQDRQLRLLQQQVQMLLEAQAKLQSSQQQTESQTQTKSTASIAVGTGASLFWPEPPLLHRDSSSSPPPHCGAPAEGAVSPPHSSHSTASPRSRPHSHDHTPRPQSHDHTPRPQSHDQSELRAETSSPAMEEACSPAPSRTGLSSVESPVLGESASMYDRQENNQESFYHNLMTQLNSRLREDKEAENSKQEVTKSNQEEETRRQSLHSPISPARSSISSHSSSSSAPPSAQIHSPSPVLVPKNKRKPHRDGEEEDVVLNATLRRLQQLGVNLDKRELSEPDRAKSRAVESASTLACINPSAVVPRLSSATAELSPSLSLLPHSSADLSLEANAIALRYLSDRQLTRLSLTSKTPKSTAKSGSDITLLSPSNMSLATRKYMRKYGLIEEESEEDEEEEKVPERPFQEKLLPQSQLIRELKPKMKLLAGNGQKQNGGRGDGDEEDKENAVRRSKRERVENQGSVGNILDLSRLRQLPKLF